MKSHCYVLCALAHLKTSVRWKVLPLISENLFSASSKVSLQMNYDKEYRSLKKVIKMNVSVINTSLFRTMVSEIMVRLGAVLFPGSNTYSFYKLGLIT